VRERARLVERHRAHATQRLQVLPPLNRMPLRAAFAMADSTVAGVAITSAQGDATTSSVIAR
jgi:hypothetical protein